MKLLAALLLFETHGELRLLFLAEQVGIILFRILVVAQDPGELLLADRGQVEPFLVFGDDALLLCFVAREVFDFEPVGFELAAQLRGGVVVFRGLGGGAFRRDWFRRGNAGPRSLFRLGQRGDLEFGGGNRPPVGDNVGVGRLVAIQQTGLLGPEAGQFRLGKAQRGDGASTAVRRRRSGRGGGARSDPAVAAQQGIQVDALLLGPVETGAEVLQLELRAAQDRQIALLLLGQLAEILCLEIPHAVLLHGETSLGGLQLLAQEVRRVGGLIFAGPQIRLNEE